MAAHTLIRDGVGRRFLVRIVATGDRYGRDDCLTHEGLDPLVEFYDYRHYRHRSNPYDRTWSERGQFVSRYYWSTLSERGSPYTASAVGLDLHGGEPSWTVDVAGMRQAWRFLTRVIHPPRDEGRKAAR